MTERSTTAFTLAKGATKSAVEPPTFRFSGFVHSGRSFVEDQGRVSRGNQVLRAELAEAVGKAPPDPRRGHICRTWRRCPLTREESAC